MKFGYGMKITIISLFAAWACLPVVAANNTIQISWGIWPLTSDVAARTYGANGTTLRDGSAEMDVDAFNSSFEMRLAHVGDGSLDETSGFSTLKWLDSAESVSPAEIWGDAPSAGKFAVYGETILDVAILGDWADADQTEYSRADEYYTDLWNDSRWTILVYDTVSKRAFRLSETPGGLAIPDSVLVGYEDDVTATFNPLFPGGGNAPMYLVAATDSRAVYVGAEIPQQCVWMADKGLAAEDVAGVDAKTLALAAALDVDNPSDVAGGVELAIKSVDVTHSAESDGTLDLSVGWVFNAIGASGEKSEVSALRGGAALYLETADSVAALGTDASSRILLDPSERSKTVRGLAQTALFARLVLDVQ